MSQLYHWLKNNLIPHKLSRSCSAYIQSAELTKFNNKWESRNDLNLYEKMDSIENGIINRLRSDIEINGKEEIIYLGKNREDRLNSQNFFLKMLWL